MPVIVREALAEAAADILLSGADVTQRGE